MSFCTKAAFIDVTSFARAGVFSYLRDWHYIMERVVYMTVTITQPCAFLTLGALLRSGEYYTRRCNYGDELFFFVFLLF